jgi:hypothetical protein
MTYPFRRKEALAEDRSRHGSRVDFQLQIKPPAFSHAAPLIKEIPAHHGPSEGRPEGF